MARISPEKLGELLSAYVDGEFSAKEKQLVERVLREDASARRSLEELRRTVSLVASLPRHAAPASLASDLRAQLERSELLDDLHEPRAHSVRRRLPWLSRLGMAAMLGLVLTGGWWFIAERAQEGPAIRSETVALGPVDAPVDPKSMTAERAKLRDLSKDSLALSERGGSGAKPTSTPGVTDTDEADAVDPQFTANLDEKLALGVDPERLQSHRFANEPVRLQVTVENEAQGEAVLSQLADSLVRSQVPELSATTVQNRTQAGPTASFQHRGRPGVNFEEPDQQQILVRATRRQIDGVLSELNRAGISSDRVALVAGPVVVQGTEQSREVVRFLGGPRVMGDRVLSEADTGGRSVSAKRTDQPVEPSQEAPRPGGDPFLEGMMKVVGLDRALPFAQPAATSESSSPESTEPVAPNAARLDDAPDTRVVGASSESPSSTEAGNGLGREPAKEADPAKSRPTLVERRMRVLEESRRDVTAEMKTAPSELDALAAEAERDDDDYVTVIVQVMFDKPSTSEPAGARTPAPPRKPNKPPVKDRAKQ